MKIMPIIASMILASSMLGYGIASADTGSMAGSGGGTPCTASFPCTKICGDHPCAPGETYTPGSQSNTTKTTTVSTSTNSTSAPSMQTQLGISASANVTKMTNGTAMQTGVNGTMQTGVNGTMKTGTNGTSMQTQVNISANATATKMTNGTMASSNNTGTTILPPPVTAVPSPEKQVSSGVAPSAVKCQSGYQLVLNKFDSRPACVSPQVMAKLVARGWALSS